MERCSPAIHLPDGTVILVRSDTTTVVSVLNKQGSNRSRLLNLLLYQLFQTFLHHRSPVKSVFLPGYLNTWANSLSIDCPIKSEWSLTQESFNLLSKTLEPQIDLSIHLGNTKLIQFVCPFPYPEATLVDALSSSQRTGTSGKGLAFSYHQT